jgi:signal transduction histidine kinase
MTSTADRFPGQEVEVMADLDALKTGHAEVDTVQIKEVFDNILNNAYQAVADKKGHIEIRASRPEDGEIMIVVKDDGVGIDAKNLEMVFEPFFTTRTRGTGLGLAVCRELVRLHGGNIRITSRPGAGTTVSVTLPGRRSEPAAP